MNKARFLLRAVAAVSLFACVAVLSFAQQGGNANGNTSMSGGQSNTGAGAGQMLSSMDRKFMMQAASGGMAEVALARLATERAASDAVKQYAQHMIDDHTRANDELMQLAASKGVTLPTTPDAKHQAMLAKMQALSGAAFDREYIRSAGIKAHMQMQKLFQKESTGGRDADTKAWAARTLPAVQDHLRMAQSMNTGATGHTGHSMTH